MLTHGDLIVVVGVRKLGSIVPRAGIEPTSPGIPGQCATITPHKLPDITTIPTIPTSMQLLASEVSAYYYIVLHNWDHTIFISVSLPYHYHILVMPSGK